MYSETQGSISINMTNLERTKLIDRYLSGEMTEEEKMSFERLLSEGDSSSIDEQNLQKEMELQQEIESAIQERGLREMLQKEEARIRHRLHRKRVTIWSIGASSLLAIAAIQLLIFIITPIERIMQGRDSTNYVAQVESSVVRGFDSGDSWAYLNQQCPQLTQLYREELKNCHSHYIFAVDVSLSMCRFEQIVRPALEAFVKNLPMGDRVTIIPFAHDAFLNKMGYDVTINAQTKHNMVQLLSTLYPQGADRRDRQYFDTDIYKAQQAVVKSVQMNQQYDVNIIVFVSDLLHCPANNIDRSFTETEMNDMRTLMTSAMPSNAENLVLTLELPQSGSHTGYIFPQLQKLYANWGVKVDQQRVPDNSEALIRWWFDSLSCHLMFTKLQSIIVRETKANPIVLGTKIYGDGRVKAHIEWKATKLYPKITLDSTYILNSDFYFKANPDYINYSEAGEMCADIDLGQIKYKDFGFHQMADTLHFDIKLPVDYQNEIDKVLEGRPGALPNLSVFVERTIFTLLPSRLR